MEVVIRVKRVKPAYHFSGVSRTSFGDLAEDPAITKGWNGNAVGDQDYDGDVDGHVGIHEDDQMVSSRPNF